MGTAEVLALISAILFGLWSIWIAGKVWRKNRRLLANLRALERAFDIKTGRKPAPSKENPVKH